VVFYLHRLLDERFAIAFEFYINVGHAFVEHAGISDEFADLVWTQASGNTRGETSWMPLNFVSRRRPAAGRIDEKAKSNIWLPAFLIPCHYMLSLCLDVDYYEAGGTRLRPLAPPALAERLKKLPTFPAEPRVQFTSFTNAGRDCFLRVRGQIFD